MKRTDHPSREDDERMRRVMDRLRLLLESEVPSPGAGGGSREPATGRRHAAVSGEIII